MTAVKQKRINWTVTKDDALLIDKIVSRVLKKHRYDLGDRTEVMMDVTCTHANGCPLRLKEMLEADDFNFFHDIFGINKHLNRATGELQGLFSPRFSA